MLDDQTGVAFPAAAAADCGSGCTETCPYPCPLCTEGEQLVLNEAGNKITVHEARMGGKTGHNHISHTRLARSRFFGHTQSHGPVSLQQYSTVQTRRLSHTLQKHTCSGIEGSTH